MEWILLAFGSGVITAVQGVVTKFRLKSGSVLLLTWAASLFSLPFFALDLVLTSGLPTVEAPEFYAVFALNTALLILANSLYFKALQCGELSRDLALLSLTPVFMLLTSWLLIDQQTSLFGVLAIVAIVVGCLLVQRKAGLPLFRGGALTKEKGSRLMLVVALIYSVTSNLDKICLTHVGVHAYPALMNVSLALCLTPMLKFKRVRIFNELKRFWLPLLLIGFLQATFSLLQMEAVELSPHVGYVIALKRGGLLVSGLVFGVLLFGERHLGWRVLGAAGVMAGLALLAFEAAN